MDYCILLVLVGDERGAEVAAVHGRALLELEAVARKMLRMQLQRLGQGLRPVALGLARQSVNEIKAHVLKACRARCFNGDLRLKEVVPSADYLEDVVVCRLHTDREPVHALRAQELQLVKAHRVGVHLDGYLRVKAHVAHALELVEDLDNALCAVAARRAAADVDAVDLVALHDVRRLAYVRQQRRLIVQHLLLAARYRVEIAVSAFGHAKRYVNVNSKSISHF